MVRARFVCQSVRKFCHWSKPGVFLHEAELTPVVGDDEENAKFFEATPSGTIKLATLKDDLFTPGKTYQVDFTEVS
jgi:hypothetical protein